MEWTFMSYLTLGLREVFCVAKHLRERSAMCPNGMKWSDSLQGGISKSLLYVFSARKNRGIK